MDSMGVKKPAVAGCAINSFVLVLIGSKPFCKSQKFLPAFVAPLVFRCFLLNLSNQWLQRGNRRNQSRFFRESVPIPSQQ